MSLLNLHDCTSHGSIRSRVGAGLVALALVVSFGAASCVDDDEGEPPSDFETATLNIEATNTALDGIAPLIIEDADGTDITLTNAQINIERIQLGLPENVTCADLSGVIVSPLICDTRNFEDAGQLVIQGPIVHSLTTGASAPAISTFQIPAIDYTDVTVAVGVARQDEVADSDLGGNTLILDGDFEVEQQKLQLFTELSFRTDARALLGGADGDDNDANHTIVLQLDVADWFENIPLTSCLEDADLKPQGNLVILDEDATGECAGVEQTFAASFEDSLQVMIVE